MGDGADGMPCCVCDGDGKMPSRLLRANLIANMKAAERGLREAATYEADDLANRSPEDPDAYLHDWLVTVADGIKAELDRLVR
jgi:hypothetical protein